MSYGSSSRSRRAKDPGLLARLGGKRRRWTAGPENARDDRNDRDEAAHGYHQKLGSLSRPRSRLKRTAAGEMSQADSVWIVAATRAQTSSLPSTIITTDRCGLSIW